MKKTKVYVDELPKSCLECPCFKTDLECPCGLSDGTQDYFKDEIEGSNCPLIDIKTHDRELVKEVLEKVKNEAYKDGFYDENGEKIITYHISNYILDQIQKEYEK